MRVQVDRNNESKEQQLKVISAAQKRCHYGEEDQPENFSECMDKEKEYYRNNAKEYLSKEDFDDLPDSDRDRKMYFNSTVGGRNKYNLKSRKSKSRKSKSRKSKSRKSKR
jgi:hypothetical protein